MFMPLAVIFLFIVRVQFPKSKSVAEVTPARYANTIKRIQILQKLNYCLCKVELDLEFLCKCNNNNVESKFLNFRVANNHLKYSSTYNQSESNFLREKIRQKKATVPILQKKDLVLFKYLYKWASFDWFGIASTLFFWINANISKISTNSCMKITENDPEKISLNFSKYELSDAEKKLLAEVLNFSFAPTQLN